MNSIPNPGPGGTTYPASSTRNASLKYRFAVDTTLGLNSSTLQFATAAAK